jgi:ribosomal protein L11 methyltransferase
VTEQSSNAWLELAVEVDHEAVEPVTELFAQYGYNEGVAIEEPFTQDKDGDNLAVDYSRPVWVRTFVAKPDIRPETLDKIRESLWHLGRMRQVGPLQVTERQEEDWANAWKEHYRPLKAGHNVVIAPPWHEYEPNSSDEVVVVLDPGMAFGTGTHPSSRLCLMALEEQIKPGNTVFDVGTGSGILAIAAAKLGASAVDAVDIEPVAVRSTRENAARNGVSDLIRVEEGSVAPDGPFVGPYDIVLANIISRVLIELVKGLSASVKPGGLLILSGVIDTREAYVRETYEPRGFQLIKRDQIEDWVGLTYRAP